MVMAVLSRGEIGRYGRQLILPEWGVEGEIMKAMTKSLIVLSHRPASCPVDICGDSRSGRSGVSLCPLPCRSWCW